MDVQINPVWFRTVSAIAREFEHAPRLALTAAQIRRLWALDEQTCWAVLSVLTQGGALEQRPDGRFVVAGLGPSGETLAFA